MGDSTNRKSEFQACYLESELMDVVSCSSEETSFQFSAGFVRESEKMLNAKCTFASTR